MNEKELLTEVRDDSLFRHTIYAQVEDHFGMLKHGVPLVLGELTRELSTRVPLEVRAGDRRIDVLVGPRTLTFTVREAISIRDAAWKGLADADRAQVLASPKFTAAGLYSGCIAVHRSPARVFHGATEQLDAQRIVDLYIYHNGASEILFHGGIFGEQKLQKEEFRRNTVPILRTIIAHGIEVGIPLWQGTVTTCPAKGIENAEPTTWVY
ncbi:MAG: hypothetical protein HZA54_02830 [Planctomycetes bacterium]|nr:hypothetical protein [Planctomycetota bacterium]